MPADITVGRIAPDPKWNTCQRMSARITGGPKAAARSPGTSSARVAILVFLGIAAILYLAVWQSYQHLPARDGASEHCSLPPELSAQGLCARTATKHLDWFLAGWLYDDTGWYTSIVQRGYSDAQVANFKQGRQSSVAFFPSQPLVARQFNRVLDDPALSLLVTTFFAGLAVAILFWTWCRDRLSELERRTAFLLLMLYPYGWYLFGSGYADALFLSASIAAFVLLERGHPVAAGIVGIVATAGRPTGLALVIGLVAAVLDRRGILVGPDSLTHDGLRRWPSRLRASLALFRERVQVADSGVLLSLTGLAAWCIYLYRRTGDAFAFATVQAAWNQPSGLRTWLKVNFFRQVWNVPGFSLRLVAQAAVALVFVALLPRILRRFGIGYAVFSLVSIVIPMLGSADFQGTGRYLMSVFPAFAAGGTLLADRGVLRKLVLGGSAASLIALTSLFAVGTYLA